MIMVKSGELGPTCSVMRGMAILRSNAEALNAHFVTGIEGKPVSDDPFFALPQDSTWNACIGRQGE